MKALRKDDKFRFSLQWSADTEEKIRVGAFLELLGNKKSDFIVMAVIEYLQRHPDAVAPGAKIKITYQPLQSKKQLMETIRGMVKASVDEFLNGRIVVSDKGGPLPEDASCPSEQDIEAMVAGLKFFDP